MTLAEVAARIRFIYPSQGDGVAESVIRQFEADPDFKLRPVHDYLDEVIGQLRFFHNSYHPKCVGGCRALALLQRYASEPGLRGE